MLNLDAMREAQDDRRAVKTFLSRAARLRIKQAAAYAGKHEYEIIEAAIFAAIPEVKKDD